MAVLVSKTRKLSRNEETFNEACTKRGKAVVPLLKLASVTTASSKLKSKHCYCQINGQTVLIVRKRALHHQDVFSFAREPIFGAPTEKQSHIYCGLPCDVRITHEQRLFSLKSSVES